MQETEIKIKPGSLFQFKGKGNADLIVRVVIDAFFIIHYKFVKEHNLRAKMNATIHNKPKEQFLKNYKPYVKK